MATPKTVGNLFDVYEGAENRYTFALLYVLDADRLGVLRDFLKSYAGQVVSVRAARAASIIAQGASREALGDGVPDGWIGWESCGKSRIVAIESKIVRGSVTAAQFARHAGRIARVDRQGTLLVVTPDEETPGILDALRAKFRTLRIRHIPWPEIAAWARRAKGRGAVARHLLSNLVGYMEMNEELIDFRGIEFPDGAFEYKRGKAILRQLLREIRPVIEGTAVLGRLVHSRPKMTDDGHFVWDVLGVKPHTRDHHITFAIHADRVDIAYTLPNEAPREKWRRLAQEISGKRFWKVVASLRRSHNSVLIRLAQRHAEGSYRFGPRSLDAEIRVKVDADPRYWAIRKEKGVRAIPEWRGSLEDLLRRGKPPANVEFQVQTRWPYGPKTASRKFLRIASRPIKGFGRIASMLS